jgi:molybdopterin-guanine dinucleotide biosynthesis protein A
MPVAIMEELGVPLATLLFIWMAVLGLRSARGGLAPLAGFLAAMFTNLAEATFFSPGGMGLMMLVVISWAATSPRTELAHVSPRRTAKRQRLLTIEVGGAIA